MSTSQKTSNDLATVSNSAIYAAFLSVKQPLLSKGSTIYRIKGGMSVFYFCLPTASFKTTSIILVILRKTIIFAHSDAGSTASGVSFYRSYKIIFVGGNQMRQRPFFDFRLNFRYAKIRFILLICNILRV